MRKYLRDVFKNFDGKIEELIPILQKVQEQCGFLSEISMREIARFTKVPVSRVYGVATFYAQFRFKPKGENHIMLCRGTACHVKGAARILEEIEKHLHLKEGQTSEDEKFSLESVACIGACSLAPCIMVNDKVEANLTPDKVEKLFGHLQK